MKYVLIIVAVLTLAGGGVAWWYTNEKKAEAAAEANAIQTARVERQNLRVSVDATGAVASNRDVDIKCKASGNIVELPYKDVSAWVKPGELLMRLDTQDEDRLLMSAKAAVTADSAKLEEARLNWEIAKLSLQTTREKDEADLASAQAKAKDADTKAQRTLDLFNQKLASQEDVDTADTTAASAKADVKTAEAAVAELEQTKRSIDVKEQQIHEMEAQLQQDKAKEETAQTNVEYCTVTAPKGDDPNDPPKWRISKMTAGIAIGYLVQSGSSGFSSGTTVMTLSDLSHIFVLATVDESDIGALLTRFNAGKELPVILTADAYRNVQFRGKVVRIATMGVNTSNVVTFEVKIEVTSANRSLLLPLMTANVEIITGERQDVLTIPAQAVSFDQPGPTSGPGSEVAAADPAPSAAPASAGGNKAGKAGQKKGNRSGAPAAADGAPLPAFVSVLKPDGTTETRKVMVGLTDGTTYEVVSGLKEGENVVLQKIGANSRWRGGRRRGPMIMR